MIVSLEAVIIMNGFKSTFFIFFKSVHHVIIAKYNITRKTITPLVMNNNAKKCGTFNSGRSMETPASRQASLIPIFRRA